jgi:hypothetical protein
MRTHFPLITLLLSVSLAAGTTADVNGDGYVCIRRVRSVAGDTLRLPVDNDAASAGTAPVEANLYRRM